MANPPIVIGPFATVPAPGSPIRSPWPQDVSNWITNRVVWTAWVDVALGANFGFPGGAAAKATYRSCGDGVEVLGSIVGLAAAASGNTAFTLPAGIAPARQITIPVIIAAAAGYLLINTTGVVQAFGNVANGLVGVTLRYPR